ncbi:NO-inducible flavohemoprotein [Echinicola strongylocentroti]|uniref:Flavohemoprotein n=1 Tax=Echinicola strongylocentroti TaxID=1795355 RepID=A0A2Z4IDB3_9BACT|nr:NO-inducible flavohemoprotein [Echinicola strongylocentroti]AWW28854.1 NO-inducible flavohemoprotein [Echinicola strongylocentroti]
MTNQKTIDIVKSTAPVLKSHGEQITRVFYEELFKHHPELKNMFNMTHQATGNQPKVLAMTIIKYAEHIDQLDMLTDTVNVIVQKHSSLDVRPEMYPIVGKYLLEAIKTVLGDMATAEILGAWEEAYQLLAQLFIGKEEKVYQDNEHKPGGFRGFADFQLINKVKESETITSLYFKPANDTPIPSHLPGQYVAISLDIPGEDHIHTRNYSLSDISNGEHLRLSVKRESCSPAGKVSNYLHDNLKVGDKVKMGMPSGDFVLQKSEHPVLLIAGGVGITPLLPMYKSLLGTGRKTVLIQCTPNSTTLPFQHEIKALDDPNHQHVIGFSNPLSSDIIDGTNVFEGFLTRSIIAEYIPSAESEVYYCGPKKFMQLVTQLLDDIGVPEKSRFFEFFGPADELRTEEHAQ